MLKHKKIATLLILLLTMAFFPVTSLAAEKNTFQYEDPNRASIQATTPMPSEAEVYNRMLSLRDEYPEGRTWTNADYYTSRSSGNIIYMGAGCHAFALILSDAAFGDLPITQHNDQSRIRVGDILRVNNDTHSVIVLEVRPDELTIAEGNYNSTIHWGRVLKRQGLATDFILTRWDNGGNSTQPAPIPVPEEQKSPDGTTTIYRLYNPISLEHLYTSSYDENKELALNHGWNSEGAGWYAPNTGTPVYRLYNPVLADHLYTTDENEVSELTRNHGWTADNDGKPLFYSGGPTNIYRLYNPGNGRHHLTADLLEYISLATQGWAGEGVKLNAQ